MGLRSEQKATTWATTWVAAWTGWITVCLVACVCECAWAQAPPPDPLSFKGPDPTLRFKDIAIEQKMNAQVPLDLNFLDETGKAVKFGDYLGEKPVILVLVYYECPMLCIEVLNGVEVMLKSMKLGVGKDFDVITLSIDPDETPELAAKKKAAHIERLNREGAAEGWHFLTGKGDAIDGVADAVGFRYAYDAGTDQFAHAAGIMVLTPEGKAARYYYGIDYRPRDVEFGLVEASEGKIGGIVAQILLLCFAYDPATGKYGFYVIGAMRIAAGLTVLGFATFWLAHYLQVRKKAPPSP